MLLRKPTKDEELVICLVDVETLKNIKTLRDYVVRFKSEFIGLGCDDVQVLYEKVLWKFSSIASSSLSLPQLVWSSWVDLKPATTLLSRASTLTLKLPSCQGDILK